MKRNNPILVDSSFFKLLVEEKEYDSDSAASLTANTNDSGDSTFLENLNPDVSLTGYVVFDVSKAAAKSKEKIINFRYKLVIGELKKE